jgi:DNA-directed RNA polymerase subunit RPC12/RpoP
MAEGRCMKCKKQVEIKEPKEITMKSGMKAIQGKCPDCDTKVFRITGKK